MRAPRWLRLRSTRRRTPGTVTVELDVDVSEFVDACSRASEALAEGRYRRRIAHQRSLGLAQVGVQLDELCHDLGLDPVETWRKPRAEEQARARLLREAAVRAYMGAAVAVPPPWDGSVA